MKILFLSIACTLLFGCASTSPIVENGQGGYFMSKQAATGFSGPGDLRAEVLAMAADFCKQQGKSMHTDKIETTKAPFVLGKYPRAEINFSCE